MRFPCSVFSWCLGLLLVALAAPHAVLAQSDDDDDGAIRSLVKGIGKAKAAAKPKFTATLTPADANTGDEVTLAIHVKLPEGFYISAITGQEDDLTKIKVTAQGLEPLSDQFTPDHEPKLEFDPTLGKEVGKFYGEVTWSRKYRVLDAAKASVTGTLEGQYCGAAPGENPACIPIRPAFDIAAQLAATSASPPEDPFSQHVQPMRKIKGELQPAPIAYHLKLDPPAAKPGEKVTLSVEATIAQGYHTFSLTQHTTGGSPTVITVTGLKGLKEIDREFRANQPFEEKEGVDGSLEIYHDSVTWQRTFEVLPNAEPSDFGVKGTIGGQYCNVGTCTRVDTEFAVGPGAASLGTPEAPVAAAPAEKGKQEKALLPFLLLCLGGGFLALLTPCSFPMVPITVSFFLHQSEAGHKRPWLLALVYCGSIIAAFTILGVGIAAFFGATKLTELANIPWLNLVIGTVFVLFALNMLGLFDVRMPSWLLTMTSSHESTGSYLGAVFMALTFTLTSFTCTFAIAGTLLLGAAQGEVYWPVIGMAAFGTAFAAPFFVLAMVPGLLAKLPKSGGWMNSVKVVMGLLELGAAVKFFSIADPGQIVLDQLVVMTMWLVLAAITGIYLFGWFRLPHDTPGDGISPLRMLLGIAFFVLGGLLAIGMAVPERGGVAVRQMLAFAPARIEAGSGPLGPTVKHHGLEFALFYQKALPVAKQKNRPILIDFTGINCMNCRDMELKMGQPAWKNRITKFVGVQLYVDTFVVPGIPERIEKQTNLDLQDEIVENPAMPSYAVLTPDGKTVLATYVGAEPPDKAGTFIKFLDEGLERWEALQGKAGAANGKLTDRKEDSSRQ